MPSFLITNLLFSKTRSDLKISLVAVLVRGESRVIDITMIGSVEWEHEGKLRCQLIYQEPNIKKRWPGGPFKICKCYYG